MPQSESSLSCCPMFGVLEQSNARREPRGGGTSSKRQPLSSVLESRLMCLPLREALKRMNLNNNYSREGWVHITTYCFLTFAFWSIHRTPKLSSLFSHSKTSRPPNLCSFRVWTTSSTFRVLRHFICIHYPLSLHYMLQFDFDRL